MRARGTSYAGEIKKSVFTILNYLLPSRDKVLSMHCSANMDDKDNTAVFFGLSGTGKTTLSTDPNRKLIGDDEHGWSDNGVFNFEGGCYAKAIRLSAEAEPDIYQCTRRFGTVLENVVMSESRRLDLDDASLTENTRAGYPISHIPNAELSGMGNHPKQVLMLTCDAFGIMPPVSKLTPDQAMYHFLSGYTAKVAGTEKGLSREPSATFSTCFGAPFMVLHPTVYANLLGEKIAEHGVDCWLVNTGWTGGPYGVGKRMEIAHTRVMVNAILDGSLNEVETFTDPIFGLNIPVSCPGVPDEVLNPRNTWKRPEDYDKKARELAGLFIENFKEYENFVSKQVKNSGPKMLTPTSGKSSTGKIKKLRRNS
jgi:phosphoenolpyruvate carboxykinase (ATP)